MRKSARFELRRMVIGAGCGAGVAVLLWYVIDGASQIGHSDDDRLKAVVLIVAIFSVLGGLAGAFLRATSWPLFVGSILGALTSAAIGVVTTFHIKGVIYAPLGALAGAVIAFLREPAASEVKPMGGVRRSKDADSVWDNELDR